MSISYHGVIGHTARATLPSVETWGANMNILRDPPKAIYTRKIDRVGDTSELTQMVQDSGDRAQEAISVYARGVNPMVNVSYDNNGNNGGQRRGNRASAGLVSGQINSGKQSFLPYRVMRDGAFRPPIVDQRELLPLSRLPRVWTSSFTQPGFADFSKKAMCPTPDVKGVKTQDEMLRPCASSNATFKLEMPIIENYEVRNVIKNPEKTMKLSVTSGINPQQKYNGEIGTPTKVIDNPLRSEVHMNLGSSAVQKDIDISHFSTENYTHEMLEGNMNSNPSQNIQTTSIEEIYGGNTDVRTRDSMNISYTAPQKGYEKYDYNHKPIELERSIPEYQANTNMGNVIHRNMGFVEEKQLYVNRPSVFVDTSMRTRPSEETRNVGSREYSLRPTISPGVSFSAGSNLPELYKENMIIEVDRKKSDMRQRVYDMQSERSTDVFTSL